MKRHLLLTMLLLMSVALLTPNIYATTANQYPPENFTTTISNSDLTLETQSKEIIHDTTAPCLEQTESVSNTVENQLTKVNQNSSNDINSSSKQTQNTKNIQSAIAAAGDESSSNVHITTQEIIDAAGRVKTFIEVNGNLPKYVQIGTTQVTMPEFLQLLTTGILQIKNNNKTAITLKGASEPANPTDSIQTGNILKTEYLELATKIKIFMESTGKAPNYATSTLGKIHYESLIYMYSRILSYYGTNSKLPNYATIKPWTTTDTGTVTPTTNSGYSVTQINEAAAKVKTFIEVNGNLPNYVQIGTTQVTMPEFLQLLTKSLIQIKSNNKNSIIPISAGEPTSPTENVQNGNIVQTEYLELATKIESFMESTGKAPNYATSTLGKIRYESLIYMYCRILNYYGTNSKLPNYATVKPWTNTDIPDGLSQYLQPTLNCQSNDPSIIALAKSLTAGKTSEYEKAVALFNWVRDNIEYAFYYNSKKGAVETLDSKSGNCCDHANLLIALNRAAGLPARYEHGICKFSDGTFGHVWAQIYVDGTWYRADAISYKNTFGVINNWDTNEWTLIGIYAELPF